MRRGRRKCQSATSILDSCSQLSRKNSVCKFPSLSFHTRLRDQSHHPKRTCTKKAAESAVESNKGYHPHGSREIRRTVSNEHTPKRQSASIRERNVKKLSGGAASSCSDESTSIQVTEICRVPADRVSTPAPTEVSSVAPPPDVDTPKAVEDRSSCSYFPTVHSLLAQPCTPPHNQPPDILVADTPERDYGLKVTWKRRRGLMMLLKERGHLSDSDVLIHSWCRELIRKRSGNNANNKHWLFTGPFFVLSNLIMISQGYYEITLLAHPLCIVRYDFNHN